MIPIIQGKALLWKRELASHENEYLAEEIPKQNVEVAIWVLLIAYRKKM